jgi:integrase
LLEAEDCELIARRAERDEEDAVPYRLPTRRYVWFTPWRDQCPTLEGCRLDASAFRVVQTARQIKTVVTYKPVKSNKGRAVARSPIMIDELRAHRAKQAEELLKLCIKLTGDSFVFALFDGSPVKPGSITNEWTRLVGKHNLPRIRLNDLGHTHATQMLAAGIHPKIAQQRLGHSTIAVTMDLYSHVLPNMQADAVATTDEALLKAGLAKD